MLLLPLTSSLLLSALFLLHGFAATESFQFSLGPMGSSFLARKTAKTAQQQEMLSKASKSEHSSIHGSLLNSVCSTNAYRAGIIPLEMSKGCESPTSTSSGGCPACGDTKAPHGSHGNSLKIIIAGAPASGKGTQCEVIKAKYGVVHLSTGDILRAAVKEGTELGKQAKAFMDGGKLVPDELIIGVVAERLNQPDCKAHGWLLDGFPRTKAQADALKSAGHTPDCFILLDVPEEVLVERVSGRRTDPVTGKIYHLRFNPPENQEIAARLFQRSDDTEEKIKIRYREFQSHITAIRSSYEDRLVHVDGTAAQKDVARAVVRGLTRVKIEKSGGVSQQTVADLVAGLMELDERIAENSHKFAEEFQRLISPTLQQFK